MEGVLGVILVYAGLMLLWGFFSLLGTWNAGRKRKIRDEVAHEMFPPKKAVELIDSYTEKLKKIGYEESNKYQDMSWYYQSKHKKRYRDLLGHCPSCNNGYLRVVKGKYGEFIGCSTFPKCKYTKNLEVAKTEYKQSVNNNFLNLFNFAYSDYELPRPN